MKFGIFMENLNLFQVFRHGDRTPVTPTYPLDPYINETYEPYGHGELTEVRLELIIKK